MSMFTPGPLSSHFLARLASRVHAIELRGFVCIRAMKASTVKVQSVPVIGNVGAVVAAVSAHAPETRRVAGPSFANAQALLGSGTLVDAVVLYANDADQAFVWLKELRGSATFALAPIFSFRRFDAPAVQALLDAVIDHPEQMVECIASIDERRAALAAVNMDEQDRLLAFLYTRPDRMVSAFRDWQHEHIYRYPILEVFAPAGMTAQEWMPALRRRALLEPQELLDRLRQCPGCSGVHLNYVDACAQCASIDIAESIFLHCHACGHVDKQEKFVAHHSLSCPKCHARLRHIGVDYDRALETFSCRTCEGRFTEPDVKASCLRCGKSTSTDNLLERRVESYRLSESGQLAARTGRVGELFSLIDETNCVHPAYFEQTLDFLLGLSRRHREIEFGLVCLKFANVRELLVKVPRVQVMQMIDGFALRLRELIRTTDMVMRSDDEHCWLLLPQTPEAGLRVLLSRIERIGETLQAAPERLVLSIASAASKSFGDARVEVGLADGGTALADGLMDPLSHLAQAWLTLRDLMWTVAHSDWLEVAAKFFPFVLLFEIPVQAVVMVGALRYWFSERAARDTPQVPYYPRVTCIITCYSEGRDVQKTIQSLTDQLYPGHIEMLPLVDGAHQNKPTADALRELLPFVKAQPRRSLEVVSKTQRGGRVSSLNQGLALASGEIVLVLDGDTSFDNDMVRLIARHFVDANVVAVSGNLRVRNAKKTLVTRLQALEYMLSIHLSRAGLDQYSAVNNISGAFGVFRARLCAQDRRLG